MLEDQYDEMEDTTRATKVGTVLPSSLDMDAFDVVGNDGFSLPLQKLDTKIDKSYS